MQLRRGMMISCVVLGATILSAQTSGTDKDNADDTRARRGISSDLAAALKDAMPAYQPEASAEAAAEAAAAEAAAEAELNQPRNDIVRLPRVVVEGRPPVFTEGEIHTDKGLREIAMQRYISDAALAMNLFRIPLFGQGIENYAMARWQEEERLRNVTKFESLSESIADAGRESEAAELRELTFDTFDRQPLIPEPEALRP